jgi:NAD-dependent dihydropyrimidine dehydrogenase PreA subunit
MTYVIAEPCIGTKDNSCVEVCPVDCIHPTPKTWPLGGLKTPLTTPIVRASRDRFGTFD